MELCIAAVVLLGLGLGQAQVYPERHRCIEMFGSLVCPQCPWIAGLVCPKRAPYGSEPWQDCLPDPTQIDQNSIDVYPGFRRKSPGFSHVHVDLRDLETTPDLVTETTDQLNSTGTEDITTTTQGTTVKFTLPPVRRVTPRVRVTPRARVTPIVRVPSGGCQRNDDCPCPLICCRQGNGCPKRCVPGLRLPPPFK